MAATISQSPYRTGQGRVQAPQSVLPQHRVIEMINEKGTLLSAEILVDGSRPVREAEGEKNNS